MTITNFQKEVTSVTEDLDLEKETISKDNKNNKDMNKNGWK